MPSKYSDDIALDQFVLKTKRSSHGCVEWTGATYRNGYGHAKLQRRSRTAHRAAYEFFVGPVPPGVCVCHQCDNRACVRPGHLFLASQRENLADMDRKGRRVNNQPKGERHPSAKLDDEAVRFVRQQLAEGVPKAQIARRLGVTPAVIRLIAKRQAWKHVQ